MTNEDEASWVSRLVHIHTLLVRHNSDVLDCSRHFLLLLFVISGLLTWFLRLNWFLDWFLRVLTCLRLLFLLARHRAKAAVLLLVDEDHILFVFLHLSSGSLRSLWVRIGRITGFLDFSFFFFMHCRVLVQLIKFQNHGGWL